MTVNEVVNVSFITKGLENIRQSLNGFSKALQTDRKTFARDIQLSDKQLLRYNKNLGVAGVSGFKAGNKFRFMTQGLRGFRMELLSVMFFGMGMANMFSGMLKPAMDTYGVFELWGTTMQVVFLPILEAIFPYMLSFMEFLMNLPEPVKIVIGAFAVFGLILGKLLFLIGSITLGLGGMISVSSITSGISAIGVAIGSLSAIALGAFAIIGIALIGIWLAWKDNFMNIQKFVEMWISGIKQAFSGMFNILGGFMKLWVSIFKGDWQGVKNAVVQILTGIKDYFVGLVKIMFGLISSLGIGLIKIFANVGEILKGMVNEIIGGVNKLIKAINSVKNSNAVTKRIPNIPEIPKLAKGGIVDKPTLAMIGEKGPEAVVPLGKGGGMGGITINYNISVTGSLKEEIERQIKDNNSWLVDRIKSLTGIRG
jgi:hypothetical protein